MSVQPDPTSTGVSFGYTDFGEWYDAFRVDTLEPGLDRAMAALRSELNDLLSERDLARIRNISGRVKSKRRTWRKVSQPRYRMQIATVDAIPEVIDDLIGVRITCTNLRDLEMVEAALDGLPRRAGKKNALGLDPTSERDYVDAPKESGYRGWHVNLGVVLNRTPLTCELQIRTLLQDSWGELTHEDTYSKDGELPPLVEVLSKRMADLLATLDDIAEDLRTELDRIDEAVVAEVVVPADVDVSAVDDDAPASGPAADAAELLLDRWRALDRPLELASLAWALQTEFGAEVSDNWFGHGSFKRFLRHAVPDGEISTGRQAYLLPAGEDSEGEPAGDGSASGDDHSPDDTSGNGADISNGDVDSVPDEARQLRRTDRGFPLIDTDQWAQIYRYLADAWRKVGAREPSARMVNQITRSARDRAQAAGEPLARRHLDYVAKAVLAGRDDGEPLTAEQVGDVFAASTLQRMADLRILAESNAAGRTRVAHWLLG
jgi:ppGpp synthetase/RelA/SpoT-type nucleotidyltranferase